VARLRLDRLGPRSYPLAVAHGARRLANYDDVLRAPPEQLAQVVDGELHLSPRPAGRHALVTTVLSEELGPPFRRGRGGPGGWLLLFEPELHLGSDILVPDLAAWRRERLPSVGNEAYFDIAPDWVCEVLSPSTEKLDRSVKLRAYAGAGVSHAWLINPLHRTLEVLKRTDAGWLALGAYADDARVRAEPFDAIELDLALLWSELSE
jgi:Uma2 family endonuclease